MSALPALPAQRLLTKQELPVHNRPNLQDLKEFKNHYIVFIFGENESPLLLVYWKNDICLKRISVFTNMESVMTGGKEIVY